MRHGSLFRKFTILLMILGTIYPTIGQPRRVSKQTSPAASANKQPTNSGGGWSGIVTYRKTLRESENSGKVPAFGRLDKERNYTITTRTREYKYVGKAIVDGSRPQTTARAKVEFSDEDRQIGKMVIVDSCHAFNDEHEFIDHSSSEKITKASANGELENFNLYVDDAGRYSLSLRFPDAKGSYNDSSSLTRSGYCQPKNNEPKSSASRTEINMKGEGISVRGQIDPQDPNVIEGSETKGGNGTFLLITTWRFTRKPQSLLITDLRFEHMKFPTWDAWEEVSEPRGTADGNLVKIKASVLNMSDEIKYAEVAFKETYKGDKWNHSMADYPLKDSTVSIRLDPGEEREVDVLWDTTGYAWFDDGRPRLVQRVKAEVYEQYKLKDEMTKNIKVFPKPLIFVHGIYSKPSSFDQFQNLLTLSHSYDWKASVFGADPSLGSMLENGVTRSVYDNADALARYVQAVQRERNAWHVDMVAHSTGGLVARLFIHKHAQNLPDGNAYVRHLLMLGTPNAGVPCADSLANYPDVNRDKLKAAEELMPDAMARFNRHVRDRKGSKFLALAGNAAGLHCSGLEPNDDFVSVGSATAGVDSFALTRLRHQELVQPSIFGDFIRGNVIIGPRGTYPISVVSLPGGRDDRRK